MPERCFYCQDQGLYCQEPSVPLIQGRWEARLDGQQPNLNPEKMHDCARRASNLASNGSKEGGVIIFAGKR